MIAVAKNNRWPWLLPQPLILASGSSARASLLRAAGIPIDVVKPDLDERTMENPMRDAGYCQADRALALARAKAMAVATLQSTRVVIAADQTLDAPGHPGTKARDMTEAAHFLRSLSGRTHRLQAAWCVAINGVIIRESIATAVLHARHYDDQFIHCYLAATGDAALQSVGCYQLENLGQHLFEKIEGDHSTILGLPMVPLLEFLRRRGMVAA